MAALLPPVLTGGLLYLLTLGPPEIRGQVVNQIQQQKYVAVGTIVTALKVLFPLSIVRYLHNLLTGYALRNWQWANDDHSQWVWGQEVAVITGGSNGIGAGVAERLGARGVKVAVLDVVPPNAELLASKGGPNVSYFKCDLRKRESVAEAAKEIRAKLGNPSILINNAGIGNAGDILDITPEQLHAIFDINMISQWYTIQEFLPDMLKKKKGHIMSVSSMSAFTGVAGIADYCAIKAGLTALHESLNQELKWRYKCTQIKTSIIYPLWTKTRLVADLEDDIKKSTKVPIMEVGQVADRMAKQILEGRRGQVCLPEAAWTNAAASVRGLPMYIQEYIRDDTRNMVAQKGSTDNYESDYAKHQANMAKNKK